MMHYLDMPRALLRGRFMAAVAKIEHNGIPMDVKTLSGLQQHWPDIRGRLITQINADYGVYDGQSFREDRWAQWLKAKGIPWPVHPSGRLKLDDDTFREMARSYPQVAPIRELRVSLSQMRLAGLAV